MPSIAYAAKNVMLNALSITSLSLHSDFDSTGGHEVSGGSPVYARLTPTFSTASLGLLQATLVPYQFNVGAGNSVAWVGAWNGGIFYGMAPNGATTPKPFVVTDPGDGTLHAPAHGFITGDEVVGWKCTSLTEGVLWTVTVIGSDSLTLVKSSDSTPPSFSAATSGYLQLIETEVFAVQGVFLLNTFAVDATIAT